MDPKSVVVPSAPSARRRPRRIRFSTLVRRTHLFLALFLTPWVLMYAVSTIAMHHRAFFIGSEERVEPDYELVHEQVYQMSDDLEQDRRVAAEAILRDLGMSGAHRVTSRPEDEELTIHRDNPFGSYRISYLPVARMLRLERQKPDPTYVLEMMHRRRGFGEPFLPNDLWAFVVDGVIVAILGWAATGLWMWWEMARTRRLGAIILLLGLGLFLVFLTTL